MYPADSPLPPGYLAACKKRAALAEKELEAGLAPAERAAIVGGLLRCAQAAGAAS